MDYQTIAIVAGVCTASAASIAILWRMAHRAPLGYEDKNGFHFGEPCEFIEVPAAANSNVPPLTDNQRAVLKEMHPELVFSAAKISSWTGIPAGRVTEAQRELFQLGLADFGPVFKEDDGRLCGRGYWLTPEGEALQRQLEQAAAA